MTFCVEWFVGVKERGAAPSVCVTDIQSVKGMTYYLGIDGGIDGGKRIKDRKRHIVINTQELLLAVKIHPAIVTTAK